jgi:hypothetical protein
MGFQNSESRILRYFSANAFIHDEQITLEFYQKTQGPVLSQLEWCIGIMPGK